MALTLFNKIFVLTLVGINDKIKSINLTLRSGELTAVFPYSKF
jgi:hypothetical protein